MVCTVGKKVVAGILCSQMLFWGIPSAVLASDIPGVSNISGINSIVEDGKTVYNIEPAKISGTTGFRQYDNFDLKEGDIANLIYKEMGEGRYDKFVNLVNNTANGVRIYGILNTINTDGAFSNGHAIFVSPGGVVIGASGVLNVGSLSLITPSEGACDLFK